MEAAKFIITVLIVFLTHLLMYVLGRSAGHSKGSHEGFMSAKRAYDARAKASPYLSDTIPKKTEEL